MNLMAENKIIQNTFFQLGQSQNERMPKELKRDFIQIDERTTADFLRFTQKFSESVRYYQNDIAIPAANWNWKKFWTNFLPEDPNKIKQLLNELNKEQEKPEQERKSDVPPHLTLFLTCLELYKQPQEVINRITGRHLDFYYQEVLRLKKKSALPDKAHVLIELKKNVLPVTITPTDLFSAGKDNTGVELLYVPTHETVVNTAQVVSLRSIFQDNSDKTIIRQASIANSADGMGEKLTGDEPKWYGFGHNQLPAAEVGFAIASPVLRMKEGLRKVTLTLTLKNIEQKQLSTTSFQGAFELFVTGEKKWLKCEINPIKLENNFLEFDFFVSDGEVAVVNYDKKVHGYSYTTQFPIVKILLKANASLGYDVFKGIGLEKAQISVEVSNVTSLKLENDGGTLDPKKAFLPFGSQPTVGSRFMVGCEEALSKKLSEVTIKVKWKGVPANFATHYAFYCEKNNINNDYFTTTISLIEGDNKEIQIFVPPISLFDSGSATASNPATIKIEKNFTCQSSCLSKVASEPQQSFIAFTLEKDFLHATYRKRYVEQVMMVSRYYDTALSLPNEPYTPTIQNISLSYTAHSDEVTIASDSLDDFANPDIQFFHITYFGQMREHGYQRKQFNFITNKEVSLLPQYDNQGELLIGLNNLTGGDSVSVLFQVAEGSANPDLTPEDIGWFVLCDNYWKPLDRSEVVLDTTNQLLTSGIIRFVIPHKATTSNTILPSGQLWIKAAIAQNVSAVCQLIEVAANAIEVQFKDNGNDPNHLLTV
jgi:hypothetical protein